MISCKIATTFFLLQLVGSLSNSFAQRMSGSITPDFNGGHNLQLQAQQAVGNADRNLVGSLGLNANSRGGPVATNMGLGLNVNDHSASASKTFIPGVGSQTRFDASANLFNTGSNRLDANAFKANTKYNGFPGSVGSHGGGLQWNNVGGHGASVGFERTPVLGQTNVFANGKANLWQSPNGMSSLDAFGSASKTVGGGKPNFGAGVGLSHKF